MHWLQALDTALFRFVNGSLSNPLFDWLMPIMSGGDGVMRWFILLVVVAFGTTLCLGSARARLCVLTMAFVVALGDPLVVNTIKHLVERPRPCLVLSGVVERLGCTASGSMPSAHAANWSAMTMVMFLFYRRSLWVMLPLALTVSFSRVYNGVHYPGDVLAGMILGAGYAVAGLVALQTVWNWVGKRWFPLWYAQMPSFLNAQRGMRNAKTQVQGRANPEPQTPDSELEWLRLGYLIVLALLIGNWIYLASGATQLSQDEAYQWVWSKHLALSYYSKPPGIAFIQFIGTALFGDNEFGVRFFSPLFAAVVSVMVLRFLAREIGARPAFWLLLILAATPLLGLGALLMTIDSPLVLCWTWAFVAGWRALQPDGQVRHWLVVGLAMGLGFLCKYSAVYLIVCLAIFFVLYPPARVQLRRPGPWLALSIFLVCTTPVLLWNGQHRWITVHHVAWNAGLNSPWHPTLRFFQDFTFQELALLNPIFLLGALWALVGIWMVPRHVKSGLWLYCFCMSAPVFLGHWLYSLHSRVQPNWIAPAVVPMFCLMVIYWNQRSRLAKPFLAGGLVLGFFTFVLVHQTRLVGKITGQPLPGEIDPMRRVQAWKQAAALVEAEREKLQQSGQPAFIICGHYGITGLCSFYILQAKAGLASEPLVYAIDSDTPQNQFYFWPEYNYPEHRRGQNAVFVSEVGRYPLEHGWFWKWLKHQPVQYGDIPPPSSAPQNLVQEFESVADLGQRDVEFDGRVLHRVHLWACYHLK